MSNEKIRALLSELRSEMQGTTLDAETRSLMQVLDSEIDDLLSPIDGPATPSSVLERAQQLETTLAVNHPTTERFIREIIDALAKMGV